MKQALAPLWTTMSCLAGMTYVSIKINVKFQIGLKTLKSLQVVPSVLLKGRYKKLDVKKRHSIAYLNEKRLISVTRGP